MGHKFRLGGPELVGLGIVGATFGAVLCGGAVSEATLPVLIGGALGGLLLPMATIIPWRRLIHTRPGQLFRKQLPH